MSLEAQLLKIIEDQQLQLKQQQQAQEEALQLIQAQSATINELKQYTQTLNSMHNEAVKIVQKYQKFVQELSEQTISATFSQDVQQNLKVQLQTRLNDLVQNLQIDNSSQKSGIEDYSASSRIGDQQSIETTSRTNHRENEFSRAVSAEISSINPTSVIKALDVLDQRKELQREQERQRSRDYDSPSPF